MQGYFENVFHFITLFSSKNVLGGKSIVKFPTVCIYYSKRYRKREYPTLKKRVSSSLMTVPTPCGLAVTSVTSDNEFLYAWQPDRKTVYKMDTCGRILCIFKLSRRYSVLHYCGNRRFYATADGERRKIYVLNGCFKEIGSIEPAFDERNPDTASCRRAEYQLFVGGAGDCRDQNCMLTAATFTDCYAVTPTGRIMSKLSSAPRGSVYTAVCENNGILYEATQCTSSRSDCVRATLLSTGDTKTQRLPYGFKLRSFFCFNGYLYAYLTQNSYHGYIAAVCTFPNNGYVAGDILDLPDDGCECMSCYEDTCRSFSCSCSSGCSVSSVQTELCDNPVSGDSTEKDCDVEELCRLYHCLKKLCGTGSRPSFGCGSGGNGSCGSCGNNGSCGSCGGHHHRPGGCHHRPSGDNVFEFDAEYDGACCDSGTLSCSCYPRCRCNENDTDDDSTGCLPLPCSERYPCPPCRSEAETTDTGSTRPCSSENLKVTYTCKT